MAVASESYAPSVLVSTEGLPEKDWLEYRRRGIGGSDAAAILGISPFATARDLYYDKLKIVPFDDSESNWVSFYDRQNGKLRGEEPARCPEARPFLATTAAGS